VTPRDVRAEIVAASIYGYEVNRNGTCPSPYSQAGGCKGHGAHETKGGAEPRCFKSDVTAEDLKRWRGLLRDSAGR